MPDYSYLEDLTDAELEALRIEVAGRATTCVADVEDLQEVLEEAEQAEQDAEDNYQDTVQDAVQNPTVEDETSVNNGGTGPNVVEFIGIDIPVDCVVYTGNGDDGLGIITSWDVPEELRVNFNVLAFVSGEKVSSEAQLLEVDYIGSIPDFEDSVLVSDEGVIIPDLFDPDVERSPDQIFYVNTGPQSVSQIFTVKVFAAVPNQTFEVTANAKPADQIFDVTAIGTYGVSVAEPPFIVEVGPDLPDQIFSVRSSATPPDRVFTVTRGAALPDQIFGTTVIDRFEVRTSFAIPDRIFSVELGPEPAADPDQIFGVSVGGPDAPPIPDPFQIFSVRTSFAVPAKIFKTLVITPHVVDVLEPPFIVSVGPDVPDQIFEVTASAIPYNQLFEVSVFAEAPDQTFDTKVINELEVDVYDRRLIYNIQEATNNDQADYIVSGEGLEFATEPTLNLTVGQQAFLYVNTPANALWIKDVQEAGPGEADPFWANVTNQGTTNALVEVQFLQVGTYYYQSEFSASASGIIEVTGVSADLPNQIFDVWVGAGQEQDQTFEITVGPEFPDQIFVVDIQGGAPPVTQIFDTIVGPEIPVDSFEVLAGAAPLSYSVINSGAGAYQISGNGLSNENNPTLSVEVGQMLEFGMNAAGHPLYVSDTNSTGTKESITTYFHDIVGQGAALGVVRVIFSQPGTYFYNCGFHGAMNGEIVVSGTGMAQKVYAIAEAADHYSVSGEGLLNEVNADISVALGETLYLSVVAPNQDLYIKAAPGTGTEISEPSFMEHLVGQGSSDGLMEMRFLLPGTYYYASSFNQNFGGSITVTA